MSDLVLKGINKVDEFTDPELLPVTTAVRLENMVLDSQLKKPVKRGGFSPFNTNSAITPIYSIKDLVNSAGTNIMLAVAGTGGKDIIKSTDGTGAWSVLKTMITANAKLKIAAYNGKFYITNGIDTPFATDLTTNTDILLTAPSVSSVTAAHNAGGNLTPNTKYYYALAYITEAGEISPPSAWITHNYDNTSNNTTYTGYQSITLASLPISSDSRVVGRLLYRTKADGLFPYLLTRLDNVSTTYTDEADDALLDLSQTVRYGAVMNTCKYILTHRDRLWMGNINLSDAAPKMIRDGWASNGTSFAASPSPAGGLPAGTWKYRVVFVDKLGRVSSYLEATATINGVGETGIKLTNIPQSIGEGIEVRIYRSKKDIYASNTDFFFRGSNFGTSLYDFVADSALGEGTLPSATTSTTGYPSGITYSEIGKPSQTPSENLLLVYPDDGDCYDDKTEILTNDGWKRFRDLNKTETVMTLNPKTKQLEWQKPSRYIDKSWDGGMVRILSKTTDSLTTPHHKYFIEEKINPSRFVMAKDLKKHSGKIPRTGVWVGIEKDNILGIPIEQFLKFMGIWLAEGCVAGSKGGHIFKSGYRICITQSKENTKNEIRELLKNFPVKFYEHKNNFIANNKGLWEYLSKLGNSHTKYIPKEIKNLPIKELTILVEWMMKGDGTSDATTKGKFRERYYTVSKKLADDFQEILLKIGKSSNVYIKKQKEHLLKGNIVKADSIMYSISIIKSKYAYLGDSKESYLSTEYYKGNIYCVEVPNHIVYVRRNGKPLFSGNSIQGLVDDEDGILVIKKNSICKILDLGEPLNWQIHKIVSQIGCDEPLSVQRIGGRVYFLNNKQLYRYPDSINTPVNSDLKTTLSTLTTLRDSGYSNFYQWYILLVTCTVSGVATKYALIYDEKFNTWYKFSSIGISFECVAEKLHGANRGQLLFSDSEANTLVKYDETVSLDGSSEITCYLKFKTFVSGDADALFRLRKLWANYKKKDGQTVNHTLWSPDGNLLGSIAGVATDVIANKFTKSSHGLTNGDRVTLSAIVSTTNISAGVIYFVVGVLGSDFQLSLTSGGTPIDLTGSNGSVTVQPCVTDADITNATLSSSYKSYKKVTDAMTPAKSLIIVNKLIYQIDGAGLTEFNGAKLEYREINRGQRV